MRDNDLDEKIVLVFDFGGGTFDVTLVEVKDEMVDVLGLQGNQDLGGREIDNSLMSKILESFQQ